MASAANDQRGGGRDAGRRGAQGVCEHKTRHNRVVAAWVRAAQPQRRRRGGAERARLRVGVRGAGGRAPGGRGQGLQHHHC